MIGTKGARCHIAIGMVMWKSGTSSLSGYYGNGGAEQGG
jgi:hypothetical protein